MNEKPTKTSIASDALLTMFSLDPCFFIQGIPNFVKLIINLLGTTKVVNEKKI